MIQKRRGIKDKKGKLGEITEERITGRIWT
jgi:hypothetical protein